MSVSNVEKDDINNTWTWPEVVEEDTVEISSSTLFRMDSSFWSGSFLPPPPRPPYLEDQISSDGVTTCDLCSWAFEHYWESKPQTSGMGLSFSYNLFVTLTIVSLLSALLGAVIMIVLLNCKSTQFDLRSHRTFFCRPIGRRKCIRQNLSVTSNNNTNLRTNKSIDNERLSDDGTKFRLSCLKLNRSQRSSPMQLLTTFNKSPPASNHYIVEETNTSINDGVYAELDRISSPAYENSGYMLEMENYPISSVQSSAYYSDIPRHHTYELVDQTTMWNIENIEKLRFQMHVRPPTTFVPSENLSTHSNYI